MLQDITQNKVIFPKFKKLYWMVILAFMQANG